MVRERGIESHSFVCNADETPREGTRNIHRGLPRFPRHDGVPVVPENFVEAVIQRKLLRWKFLPHAIPLIVIPRLQENDLGFTYAVNQPVLSRDAARPGSRQHVLQRFRLTDSNKRIAHYDFHQVHGSKRGVSIGLDPVDKIPAKPWMKNGSPVNGTAQARFPCGTRPPFEVFRFRAPHREGRGSTAGHCAASAEGAPSPAGSKARQRR